MMHNLMEMRWWKQEVKGLRFCRCKQHYTTTALKPRKRAVSGG